MTTAVVAGERIVSSSTDCSIRVWVEVKSQHQISLFPWFELAQTQFFQALPTIRLSERARQESWQRRAETI